MISAAGVSAPDGHELTCWQSGLWGALLRELERQTPEGLDQNWVSCFGFRPETAERILQQWVEQEPLLDWWSATQLIEVSRLRDRIDTLTLERDGRRITLSPTVVIDGSDLGDLLALASVPHRWGWEAQEVWQEPSAPSQQRLDQDPFFKQQPIQSPTWVVMGQLQDDGSEGPPPLLDRSPEPPFQACLDRFGLFRTLTYGRLPGGLVMLNWPLQGNDWHQGLDRCISPDHAPRAALADEMQRHSKAFFTALQQCSGGWLQPGAGFPGVDRSLALMPYWREGRRLRGCDVVTEQDLLPLTVAPHGPIPTDHQGRCTSIAVGTYANDHHYPGEDWPLAPKSIAWGGRWTGTPFCIPYGALISGAVTNLLMADKAISVSHMANGATRLQPLILNIGQAAGMAAAMAIQRAELPADLPVQGLQEALISDPLAPAAVMPLWTWPVWHPNWREAQRRSCACPEDLDAIQPWNGLKGPDPGSSPITEQAAGYRGRFRAEAPSSWFLETETGPQPVITLEPGVEKLLSSCPDGSQVSIIAVANPWGPWLRVLQADVS